MDNGTTSIRNTVASMRDAVLFEAPERRQRLNRFWILLILSTIIASAGVVADSTATVIGAMIVAPMLLPIQGTMLSTVLGDRTNLVRSIALVIAGASASVAIGYLIGLSVANEVVAATNTQVAGRVNPGLMDLLAALGTGVVGSIALIRRDISDTLPGVAIAISLVPPLAVAGLTLESGAYSQALGALLLFATNVAAILVTGIAVMAFYGVGRVPPADGHAGGEQAGRKPVNRRHATLAIVSMLLIVGIPLTISSISSSRNALRESSVRSVAETWTKAGGWVLLQVNTTHDGVVVRAAGPLPLPDAESLKKLLIDAGIDPSNIDLELVPSYKVKLGGP